MNLAWNWARWGRPSGPRVGAVVVWPHHVGMITGQTADGRWIVRSGNDGGRVRERPRSVAGAVFRISPHIKKPWSPSASGASSQMIRLSSVAI